MPTDVHAPAAVADTRQTGAPAPAASQASAVDAMIRHFNDRQREAVTMPMESCLVLAGAGSGKTAVLTARICYMIEKLHVDPERMLAVTFTNKAAEEMKRRLKKLIGEDASAKIWVGTFHGLCNRILRQEYEAAHLPKSFAILDVDSQERIVRDIMKERSKAADKDDPEAEKEAKKDKTPGKIVGMINEAKEAGKKPFDIDEELDGYPLGFVDVFVEYQEICRRQGLLDFQDLQTRSLELLMENEDVLAHFQRKFQAVFVDEFQDTNEIQYQWLQKIGGGKHGPDGRGACVMAVGDDDQSIYGFRGAQPWNMQRFLNEFARGKKVALEQNYRSRPFVLDAANNVIGQNKGRLGKNLFSAQEDKNEQIISFVYDSEFDEAAQTALRIKNLIEKGAQPQEIAVLYRTNTQSRLIEQAMLKANIPVTIYGGYRFYDRQEVKNLIAYLDLACNVNRDISFSRIVNMPPRGLGERTTQSLHDEARQNQVSMLEMIAIRQQNITEPDKKQLALEGFLDLMINLGEAAEKMSLSKLVDHVLHESGLLDYYGDEAKPKAKKGAKKDEDDEAVRHENMLSLVDNAEEFEKDFLNARVKAGDPEPVGGWKAMHVLPDYLAEIALMSSTSDADMKKKNTVSLMTVHSSKGLEFDHVFIAGVEEGTFPHKRSIPEDGMSPEDTLYKQKMEELEEERRLMYVAITRARKSLVMTRCKARKSFGGEKEPKKPSRFLAEIPKNRIREMVVNTYQRPVAGRPFKKW